MNMADIYWHCRYVLKSLVRVWRESVAPAVCPQAQPNQDIPGLNNSLYWRRRYVLKNLVRDWGAEGAAERAQSYGRILAELRARYPVSPPLTTCSL